MMLCPKCGKENEDDASLCAECGATLNKQETPALKKSPRRKYLMLLAIAGIAVVILVLIGVCVAFISIAPRVDTADATGVTGDSATLNGELVNLGTSESVEVSFQWGTSPGSYTNETEVSAVGKSGEFSSSMTGLTSNTIYYYRAKAVGDGTGYGSGKSFTTLSP